MRKAEAVETAYNVFEITLPRGRELRECRVIRHPTGTKALIELGQFTVTITFTPARTPVTREDFDFELHY